MLAAALASFLLSLCLTPLVAAAAKSRGFTARFNPVVPQDREPAALGGGLAIYAATLGGVAVAALASGGGAEALRLPLAAAPALLMGLVDDVLAFRPAVKLLLQIAAAAAGMAILLGGLESPAAAALLIGGTMTALVLMNAINLLDASDAYAGAVSIVSFAGIALIAGAGPTALAVAGGCLGFLAWNRPPARIYMGDAGPHVLGMLGALLIVATAIGEESAFSGLTLLGCFGVALCELVFLILVRTARGHPFWRGSSDHSALRLQRAGVGKGQAALLAAGVQLALVGLVAAVR